ncbi:Monosaccharide-sensing protein 2 [Striga hermonthica]|uniref:Monosaccharide-sensing protein 2 n=1 Tax=Striga hermonthica TaxID=68872 RepID=A0A9N7N889_STRHE|nr:Monosaccharide-sensing protein 2 [Striga hermonthica]
MRAAMLVAVVAALGNLIQGWDNATMAVGIVHIKREFNWENEPGMVGLTVAMSLIGGTIITFCSGGLSDWLGRRPMLIISSALYFISSLFMLWAPSIRLLLFARLLDGFGIGLSVTIAPLYISEMSPPEIRGLLSTFPQFMYTSGMFLSYALVFCVALAGSSSWRLTLGFLAWPSLVYFVLTAFYLPESPRWLLSKGRMLEAKRVLQRLRGKEDVSGEMAFLVEGLEVGEDISIEEYIIAPSNELLEEEKSTVNDKEELIRPEGLSSVIALRIPTQSFTSSILSRHQDPVVTLFDSVHEKLPEASGSKGSYFFPHLASMFSNQPKNNNDESDEDYESNSGPVSDTEESLQSPLISRQGTSCGNLTSPHHSNFGSYNKMKHESHLLGDGSEKNGGWQLAWKWKEGQGSFKRVYLHESDSMRASGLVSQSALCSGRLMDQPTVGPAVVHPSVVAEKGPKWNDLFEPGVKHALVVGMGIQMLQQFLGINAISYYTPQILEQAGVQVLFSDIGISPDKASLLISAVMILLTLLCVIIAMRLMDVSGRRSLLLNTNPILTASLVTLVVMQLVHVRTAVKAAVSTASVVLYSCFFSMGFGPIPNILCSEIFPTKVRGVCIAMCALTYWICNIMVTYSLPMMLSSIGISGAFSIYAFASLVSWAFVYWKVPETKGMPLEVITEFFAMGAKKSGADTKSNKVGFHGV